jgi:(E)-4-hydroxy-3-methylbut-2-enyl-diphosphate synthase
MSALHTKPTDKVEYADPFNYNRRVSSVVQIGNVLLGGVHPIRLQSMANVSTMDTKAAVQQAVRLAEAGAELIRFTTQGKREARNLGLIRSILRKRGYTVPLVADVHFNPLVADVAATQVEKVRINPGNYAATPEDVRLRFVPLLRMCRQQDTALRIGVNHGSLSGRILDQYGDTPQGMVASCMEYLRICREEGFHRVVLSVKASNTVVMVQTVRLLARVMDAEGMHYPLHLGVTEAGDGEDGRIKSAVGIGVLLADGLGDTIRVSLSEEPEAELPVAQKLLHYIAERKSCKAIVAPLFPGYDPLSVTRRTTRRVGNIGGDNPPVVVSTRKKGDDAPGVSVPDYVYIGKANPCNFPDTLSLIVDLPSWKPRANVFPSFAASEIDTLPAYTAPLKFVRLTYGDLNERTIRALSQDKNVVLILSAGNPDSIGAMRAAFHQLMSAGCDTPVILHQSYEEADAESLQVKAAVDFGALLLDGFGNGVMLHHANGSAAVADGILFSILQATRVRISKTEYISCPGCGRTLYDLQTAVARIKKATSHLKGLKIAVMGCIVNGPGEMADADYGYVGSGRGKIDLYKGKTCVHKAIPEAEAVDRLVHLIREEGDWKDK